MRRRLLGLAAACVRAAVASGCKTGTEQGSVQSLDGIFLLTSVDESPLPTERFPLPTRDGEQPKCFAIATHGWLELKPVDQSFVQVLHLRDSCGINQFGSDTIAVGRFDLGAETIVLTADRGNNRMQLMTGRLTATTIEIDDNGTRYRYRR